MTILDELIIRSIKVIDIGYIAVIYFTLAFFISGSIDKWLGKFEAKARKSTLRLAAEVILHIWCIGVIVYIVRNIVERIPFPLNGIRGFEHRRVKELSNAAVFTFVMLFFQKHLRHKLEYLYERVFGSDEK
jgi:hypothetical protein